MKKVTIKDLARETNLSITQVSKALNGYPDVNKQTKMLVIDKAAEMGYVPNKGARALASKKMTEITVINLNMSSAVTENIFLILQGIYFEAEKSKLKVSVDFISTTTVSDYSLNHYLVQNGITNPIIIGLYESHPYYQQILDDGFNIKAFVLDNKIDKTNIINVNVDDDLGVRMATDYFIEKNYKRALVVAGDFSSYVNNSRLNSTKKHFNEAGITFSFIYGNYKYDDAKAQMLEHSNLLDTVDVIFCFSDIMAVGINAAMHEIGEYKPLVGFDGLEITNYVYPKISTVSQSFYEKGVEIVKRMTSEFDEHEDIVVEPKLIIRK